MDRYKKPVLWNNSLNMTGNKDIPLQESFSAKNCSNIIYKKVDLIGIDRATVVSTDHYSDWYANKEGIITLSCHKYAPKWPF